MLKLTQLVMVAAFAVLGTGFASAENVSALETTSLETTSEAEAQGSCYGYQPMCTRLNEQSCCICNAQGFNCKWGCCRGR